MKRFVFISFLGLLVSALAIDSYSDDLSPYYTSKGRLVYPTPLPEINAAKDILDFKIPFLKSSFEYDHGFLFNFLGSYPINIEYSQEYLNDELLMFRKSEEYDLISFSLRKQKKSLPRKEISYVLETCFKEWKYAYKLSDLSLSIFPEDNSILKEIKVPAFSVDDFSFNRIDRNEIIQPILEKNSFRLMLQDTKVMNLYQGDDKENAENAQKSYFEKLEKRDQVEKLAFKFSFDGGTLFDYFVAACDACMTQHPGYFVTFRFEPNKRFFSKNMALKNDCLYNIQNYQEKNVTEE